MRIVAISDTHQSEPDLPEGDILIHSGDLTFKGRLPETLKQLNWLERQKKVFKEVILIPGNHDFLFEKEPNLSQEECSNRGLTLLNDSEITLEGFNFWGSPVTPWFNNWAFNRNPGKDIKTHWNKIPEDTNILITHGPPYGILDEFREWEQIIVGYDENYKPIIGKKYLGFKKAGCKDLLERVKQLKSLRLHVFGHIHEGYGVYVDSGVRFVNAAVLNGDYKKVNKPIVINL